MPDQRLFELPASGALGGSELFYSDNGADVKVTADQIKTFAKQGLVASDVSGLAAVATSGLAADVGLGNVDNTSDLNKPISTATQAALDVKQPLDATLTALAALDATVGLLAETAADTFARRTLTGTANEISIANGDGVVGNPIASLPAALTFTGKTVTGGTFSSPTINTPTGIVKGDVGLSNVTNDAQTKAAIVPNTVPAAGQVLAGNGTAYAPVSVSGDATFTSLGALAVTKLNGVAPGAFYANTDAANLTGTINNARLSAIPNAALANPSITIAGHSVALGGTQALTATDVGLGSVTNDAQTKAAVVPNTAPAAGRVLVGNAGGTAYAPQSISGDVTLASTGAATVAKVQGLAFQATTYSDGQVPAWSAANSRFQPGTGGGGSGNLGNLLYDITANSGVGDGVRLTDGAITTGTNTFSSVSATFALADVGKTITIKGAGASGTTLATTIAGFTDTTHVTLTANAGTTVSAALAYYGTDNLTAINNLITTVNGNGGGTILFPKGLYLFSGTIDLSLTESITLTGQSRVRTRGAQSGHIPSGLIYTGTSTSTTNFPIKLGSCYGCTIKNLWLGYSNTGMAGSYIYIVNTGTGDPTYNMVTGCLFYAGDSTMNSVLNWIWLDKAILTTISDNTFQGGACGIQFAATASSYCNVCKVDNNSFLSYTSQAMYGGGETINVTNNTFEQSTSNTIVAYNSTSSYQVAGFVWIGNWFGDGTSAATAVSVYGVGFVFQGNFIVGPSGGTALQLNNVSGFSITGNEFYTWVNGINYATASSAGGIVQGNNFHSVTNIEVNTANKAGTVSTANNSTV